MFDTQNTGAVDIHQFEKLFAYVNQWLNVFKTYDRNGSGLVDDQELNQGISWYFDCTWRIFFKNYLFFDYFCSIFSNGFQFLATIHKAVG